MFQIFYPLHHRTLVTTDREGSKLISKAIGGNVRLAPATEDGNKPSKRALEKMAAKNVK